MYLQVGSYPLQFLACDLSAVPDTHSVRAAERLNDALLAGAGMDAVMRRVDRLNRAVTTDALVLGRIKQLVTAGERVPLELFDLVMAR